MLSVQSAEAAGDLEEHAPWRPENGADGAALFSGKALDLTISVPPRQKRFPPLPNSVT